MAKRSIRDFWAKRTEKKTLSPEMRTMLLKGYEQQPASSASRSPAGPGHHVAETRERGSAPLPELREVRRDFGEARQARRALSSRQRSSRFIAARSSFGEPRSKYR